METKKNPKSPESTTIDISSSWLAYITGGLFVIANAYQLPLAVSIVTGSCGPATVNYAACPNDFTVFPYAFTAIIPAILVILGLLLIVFKRKSIAQLGAIAIFVLLAALYYPLFNATSYTTGQLAQTTLWYYLLQPTYLFPVVELLLAAAGSLYLREPSIFSHVTRPIPSEDLLSRIKKLRGYGLYVLIAAVALIVFGSGYAIWHASSQKNHDSKELKALSSMSQTVYHDIAAENPVNQHAVSVWKSKESVKAENQGLTLRDFNDSYFTICGMFDTNQSGMPSIQATDIQPMGLFNSVSVINHPAGSACIKYPVTNEQVQRPNGGIAQDQLLTDIRYEQFQHSWVISTYSLSQSSLNPAGDVPVSSLQIIKPDGSKGQLQDLVTGSVVSVYYEINVLSGTLTAYKLAITNDGSDGANCSVFATDEYQHSPSPDCPATVNNVTLARQGLVTGTQVLSDSLNVTTTPGTSESASWENMPDVYDSSGHQLQYSQLSPGTKADLVYSGPFLTTIREIAQ